MSKDRNKPKQRFDYFFDPSESARDLSDRSMSVSRRSSAAKELATWRWYLWRKDC